MTVYSGGSVLNRELYIVVEGVLNDSELVYGSVET